MRKIFLAVFVIINTYGLTAQESMKLFWDELLKNNREEASQIYNNANKNGIESLLIGEILREELGQFTENRKFTEAFINHPDFEYYLYALWNKSYFFDTYLTTGFNKRNKNAVQTIAKANISNIDLADAIKYLQSVVNRENNDWTTYFELNKSINAIKDWQFCGVFENLNESGLDKVYEPETKYLSNELFNASSNGYVGWYTPKITGEPYQFFTNHEWYGQGVNYAQTFIHAEKDTRVVLSLGSGSAFKVWLNDILIYKNTEDVTTDLNAYKIKVTIPKGENRLLIKCAEKDSGSYFIVRTLNEDGSINNTLEYSSKAVQFNKSNESELNPELIENNFEIYFRDKVKNNPDDFFYAYCLTNAYLRNSKYEEAKKVLQDFAVEYPKSSIIRKMMMIIYSAQGDVTSYNELKKNMELDDPDYYLPIVLKIRDSSELGRMTLEELKAFIDKFKSTVDNNILSFAADFLYEARKENLVELRKMLDNIIAISDDNISILLSCAPLYGNIFKEDDKTIELLESINDKHFTYQGIKTLARYYDNKKEKEKSLKILSKDLDKLSTDNTYIYEIVNKMHNYRLYKESMPYIDSALENFPYCFEFLELKGDALVKMGDNKEALLAYQKALKHNSGDNGLRKKIRDLKNEPNILNEIVIDDVYKFVEQNRGKIKSNNYGYNILNDDSNIELYSEGGGRYRFVYLYEITSNEGIESFKEYDLGLSGNYHIIKSEIIKPDGSIVPADRQGSSFVFKGLAQGDVIYLDYENSFASSGRFYKDYSDKFILDSYHPLVASSIKLVVPKGKSILYKVVNGSLEPQIKKKDEYDLYEWKVSDLSGIPQYEDYMESMIDVGRSLHVSTIPNWNEISLWYSDLVRSNVEIDAKVKEVFASLFPNGHKDLNEEERARVIYNYIKNNFTYSYVGFRQSGFVPQKPSKTIKTALGDCKDFSTLFLTLARMADLKCNLVLVLTSDNGRNDLVLPSTDFNHCIVEVNIDGKNRFLELTDKYLPFKSLPTNLRGATALEIPFNSDGKETYDLIKLDNLLRDKSFYLNDVFVNVGSEGMEMKIDTKFTGHINSYYASVLDNPNPEVVKKSIYENLYGQLDEDFTLNELTNIKRVNNDSLVQYETQVTLNKKINKIGSINIFQLPIVSNPYTSSIVSLEARQYPIEYNQYENVDEYINNYDIVIDSNMDFIEIPESKKLTFGNHIYEISYTKLKANHLKVRIYAKPSLENIEVKDYDGFKNYVKSVLEAQKEFIGYK